MNEDLRATGRFVRYHGAEFRLGHSAGKWWISSDHAVDESFVQKGRRHFVRPITHADVLDCYDVACPGTYRGLFVEVSGNTTGGYWLTARDQKALTEGFERTDHRSPWQKLVASDDPELHFTTTVTPVPMPWKIAYDWNRFTERLSDAFRDVTDNVFLIVHAKADPRRYVQFAGAPDRLYAEAPGTDVVPDADEFQLRRFDWTAPEVAQPNWTLELRRPALTVEFQRLAEYCAAALRGAYGLTSPDELTYRAWRQPPGSNSTAVEFAVLGLG